MRGTVDSLDSLDPLLVAGANLANWEGSHIDVSESNRAIDWWYTQIVAQTAAPNGVPPSIEIVMKRGKYSITRRAKVLVIYKLPNI